MKEKQISNKKTICFAIDANVAGGAERVLTSLANYFAQKEYDVTVINSDKESSFYALSDRVTIVKMGIDFGDRSLIGRLGRPLKKYVFLRDYLSTHKVDKFIVFLINMEIPGIFAGRRTKTDTYTSLRNSLTHFSVFQRCFMKAFYPKIAGVVFQNRVYVDGFFRKVKNKTVIFNPASLNNMYDGDITEFDKRKNWIINVGRLSKQKNQALLIEAFAEIADEYPEMELHIFGNGELRKALESKILEFGLENRAFLDGTVLDALYINRNSKVFALPSLYEGFPNALIEAMSYGIPSISTNFDTGIAEELITQHDNGCFFQIGNKDLLVKELRYVLSLDKEAYMDMARKASEVREKYTLESIGKEWENFLFNSK